MKFFMILVSFAFINLSSHAVDSDFEKVYSCFKSYPNGNIQSKVSFQKLLNKNKSFGLVFSFDQYTTDYSTNNLTQIKKEISGYTEIQQQNPIEGFENFVTPKFEMNLETFNLVNETGSWNLVNQEKYLGLVDLKESTNAYSLTIKIFSAHNTQKVIFATNFTCNKL